MEEKMDNIEQYRDRIEAVKLSVEGLECGGIVIPEVIQESILELVRNYKRTNNQEFIIQALIHIQAYMEMGFSYEDNDVIFDYILSLLDLNRNIMYPPKFYTKKELKLTKNAIKGIIGKWPNTKGRTMSLENMTKEIISNCTEKKCGVYDYVCPMGNNSKLIKKIRVVISEEEQYLYYFDKKIYYFFI